MEPIYSILIHIPLTLIKQAFNSEMVAFHYLKCLHAEASSKKPLEILQVSFLTNVFTASKAMNSKMRRTALSYASAFNKIQ